MTGRDRLFTGTAAWSIPREVRGEFTEGSSVLATYASRFNAVEINSSFYRPHKPGTYARWAQSVPAGFRFAVKVPRAISHEGRLAAVTGLLDTFLSQVQQLDEKLGVLLLQLPPKLDFESTPAARFFEDFRKRYDGPIAFEPRHPSWFTDAVTDLLLTHRVARVAADPAPVPGAATPAGWPGMGYYRWHGSPRIYWTSYEASTIKRQVEGAHRMLAADKNATVWCIYDNTASGAATRNALEFRSLASRR